MRSNDDLRYMMREAMRLRDEWAEWITDPDCNTRELKAEAVRNYNALRGVVQTLQWVMEFPGVQDPLY